MDQFSGKTAVITGGASGLGKEFARMAADLGMKLVLADIQQDALESAINEFEAAGVEVIGMRVDVSKLCDVQVLADAATDRFGHVHLLFNNAGVAAGGLLWEHSQKDWDWVLGVNLHGVINGVKVFTPLMLNAARDNPTYQAHVINTASMAGILTAPNMGLYGVSKHAVVALSESLYHDLGLVTEQVSCSVLCPYFVPTAISSSDRNRPVPLANDIAPTKSQLISRALSESAVSAGDVTAGQVSQSTFDAIRKRAFYIFSHPHRLQPVANRFETMMGLRNPLDPYSASPEMQDRRARLVEALRT